MAEFEAFVHGKVDKCPLVIARGGEEYVVETYNSALDDKIQLACFKRKVEDKLTKSEIDVYVLGVIDVLSAFAECTDAVKIKQIK